jgi:hypothetical protein
MVQAGRRGFDLGGEGTVEETSVEGSNPGGDGLEDRVRAVLSEEGVVGWEELLEAVSGDLEGRLESTLERLEDERVVRYKPRQGGYALVDHE